MPGVSSGVGLALAAAVPSVPPKLLTLVIPHIGGRLLLGKKLRGFGEGYWNGFGGKVEAGETVEAAARRELQEEAGITATAMHHCGRLTFVFDDRPQPWAVHVFRVEEFEGEPSTSDEMEPRWFEPAEVPYDQMWADDAHWYPLFLAGQAFEGVFFFRDTHTLVRHELRGVATLHLPSEPCAAPPQAQQPPRSARPASPPCAQNARTAPFASAPTL